MALSRKTLIEFRKYLASRKLKEIRDVFESEGIQLPEGFVLPESGQRRSLAEAYLSTIDLNNHDLVTKILKSIEHTLVQIDSESEKPKGTYAHDASRNALSNLLVWLDRDGYEFFEGWLAAKSTRGSNVSEKSNPDQSTSQSNVAMSSATKPDAPKCFISYSWDSDDHNAWVKSLATRLRGDGVDVTLDRWHAAPGDQIPAFMERAVRENDFVIAVCTPQFKEKSDRRGGGVGYEGDIMTAYAFTGSNTRKFIPVLRRGSWEEAAPTWLLGKARIDLNQDPYSESHYQELLRTLHGESEAPPLIGPRPDFKDKAGSQASEATTPVTPSMGPSAPQPQSPVTPMSEIKVLFLSANPEGTSQLNLDEEIREITSKIRGSQHRDSVKLISLWAVRPDDLLQALNEHQPHVVHFSGHGSKFDEIILLDNNRQPKPVPKAALVSLFKTLKDNIRLVVLNACFSKPQAEAISSVIDCTIGMSMKIGDDAAIIFAASLYRAIGFGRSIQGAFEQATTALMLEGVPEDKTPELLVRSGQDASKVVLINP